MYKISSFAAKKGFIGSKIRGFIGSKIHGFIVSEIHGFEGSSGITDYFVKLFTFIYTLYLHLNPRILESFYTGKIVILNIVTVKKK